MLLLCNGGRLAWGHPPAVLRESPWLYVLCGREKSRNKSECFMFGVRLGHLVRRHLLILTGAKNKVNINSRWHADELCIE